MFLTGLVIHRGLTISHDEKLVAWSLVFLVVPTLPTLVASIPGYLLFIALLFSFARRSSKGLKRVRMAYPDGWKDWSVTWFKQNRIRHLRGVDLVRQPRGHLV
jgi:hypothetical protein